MQEYKDLRHMVESKLEQNLNIDYFLLHHGVYKPENLSTAFHIVFNASMKTTNQKSLNYLLKEGIKQEDLFSLMLRFRKDFKSFLLTERKCFIK